MNFVQFRTIQTTSPPIHLLADGIITRPEQTQIYVHEDPSRRPFISHKLTNQHQRLSSKCSSLCFLDSVAGWLVGSGRPKLFTESESQRSVVTISHHSKSARQMQRNRKRCNNIRKRRSISSIITLLETLLAIAYPRIHCVLN